MKLNKITPFLILSGALLLLLGFLLAFLNSILGLFIKPADLGYQIILFLLQPISLNFGTALCTTGYILANEGSHQNFSGQIALLGSITNLVHWLSNFFHFNLWSFLPDLNPNLIVIASLAAILQFFFVSFTKKAPGFQFSFSLWASLYFALELCSQFFPELPVWGRVGLFSAIFATKLIFLIVAFRYALRKVKTQTQPLSTNLP